MDIRKGESHASIWERTSSMSSKRFSSRNEMVSKSAAQAFPHSNRSFVNPVHQFSADFSQNNRSRLKSFFCCKSLGNVWPGQHLPTANSAKISRTCCQWIQNNLKTIGEQLKMQFASDAIPIQRTRQRQRRKE